jgi:hypothetical protein
LLGWCLPWLSWFLFPLGWFLFQPGGMPSFVRLP